MLRYRRIKSYFFTDAFFVTKKAESSRGYTCMQIFVSDKGYVSIAAMKSVSEFTKALKMFAKGVGVPEAIISKALVNSLTLFIAAINTYPLSETNICMQV